MEKHINYRGFWMMLALMFGFTIFSASVMSGAGLANSIKTWEGIVAIVIGNLALALYGGVLAYVSNKRRKNLDGSLKRIFGKYGAVVPSIVMVLTQLGWFGVGVAMVAKPIASQLGVSPWIFVFVFGIFVMVTAFFGIKSLTIISMIAVPLVLILGFVAIGMSVDHGTYQSNKSNSTNFFMAISIVIGTFISGATFVPNFAVNAKSPKIAVTTTALAFFVGNGLMILFGFISQLFLKEQVNGFSSITKAIAKNVSGGPILVAMGMIILILNIWTTNDSGLYSISLGFNHWIKAPWKTKSKWIFKEVPKRVWVLVFGLIGCALSLWLYDNFIAFLQNMNRFVPPIGALIMFNYFFKKRESRFIFWGINFGALFLMSLATGITFIPAVTPYAPLVSFGIIVVTYLPYVIIEERFFPTKNLIKKDKKDELENDITVKKHNLSK